MPFTEAGALGKASAMGLSTHEHRLARLQVCYFCLGRGIYFRLQALFLVSFKSVFELIQVLLMVLFSIYLSVFFISVLISIF